MKRVKKKDRVDPPIKEKGAKLLCGPVQNMEFGTSLQTPKNLELSSTTKNNNMDSFIINIIIFFFVGDGFEDIVFLIFKFYR